MTTGDPRTGARAYAMAVVGTVLAGLPGVAHAAGGEAEEGARSTGTVVLLVFSVAMAYLLAHFVVDRLQKRFLIMIAAEYLLLGILLGPLVPAIHAFDNLTPLLPIIALAAAWVGLLRGTELNIHEHGSTPKGTIRVLLLHHLVAGSAVGVAAWFFFTASGLMSVNAREAALTAALLGCCASSDATGPIALLSKRYGVSGKLIELLSRSALLGDLLVIAVFGLIFCVFHEGSNDAALSLRPTEWAVVSVGLGIVLGLLFTAFLVGDESANGRFLALVGIITLASGAAWFLALDPLMVNMVLGVVVVNTCRYGGRIRDTLSSTSRPMFLVLLVFAGALFQPPAPMPTILALGGFLVARTLGKIVGSMLASWGTELRPDLFRGLLGHGEVPVAMAVSFRLVYQGDAVDVAYTVVLASVVLNDLVAPRLLRSLLVDAGDITGEAPVSQSLEEA